MSHSSKNSENLLSQKTEEKKVRVCERQTLQILDISYFSFFYGLEIGFYLCGITKSFNYVSVNIVVFWSIFVISWHKHAQQSSLEQSIVTADIVECENSWQHMLQNISQKYSKRVKNSNYRHTLSTFNFKMIFFYVPKSTICRKSYW